MVLYGASGRVFTPWWCRPTHAMVVVVMVGTILCAQSPMVRADDHVVEVDANVGTIVGVKDTADNGDEYFRFMGIPYAQPPVGDLRLAKPEKHPEFETAFDATSNAIINCPYPNGSPTEQVNFSEDCLVLNVLTKHNPNELDGEKKKVMVFIHGGAFYTGSGYLYHFSDFVTTQDVIVVSINYRLGVLGFLSTENAASPGNFGLWDQHMAIQWVKDNIAAFGGDADDLTLSGESAGSMSIGFHTISPHSKGMFKRVHMHSGGATSRFALSETAQEDARGVAQGVGCLEGPLNKTLNLTESRQMIECLRSKPYADITAFMFSLSRAPFVPVVDNDFISDKPLNLLKNEPYLEDVGYFDLNFFLCYNNAESLTFLGAILGIQEAIMNMQGTSEADKNAIWEHSKQETLIFYKQQRLSENWVTNETISEEIDMFYNRRNTDAVQVLTKMLTDLNFYVMPFDHAFPTLMSDKSHAYMLYFDYYPEFMKGNGRGFPHGGNLMYWMGVKYPEIEEYIPGMGIDGTWTEEDKALTNAFSDLVGEFVRNGDPQPALDDVEESWEFDLDNARYLVFNSEPFVREWFARETTRLWWWTVPELMGEKLPESFKVNAVASLCPRSLIVGVALLCLSVLRHLW